MNERNTCKHCHIRGFILLMLWANFYLLLVYPWRMLRYKAHKSNCVDFALHKWHHEGGYLVIRWCRNNRLPWLVWPHFLWLPMGHYPTMQHLNTEDEDRFIPEFWFEGRVYHGDEWH